MPETGFKEIKVEGWKRESVFRLYSGYADPLFNISGEIDVTRLRNQARDEGLAFSKCVYYHSLNVCNEIEEFRLRITKKGTVILYDEVHGGTTVPGAGGTFGFVYFRYVENQGMKAFCEQFGRTPQKPEKKQGSLYATAQPSVKESDGNLIRHTMVPWFSFSSVKHPRSATHEGGIPKIAFGKFYETTDARIMMPVAVEAHHGLMDGRHACDYLNTLQDRM